MPITLARTDTDSLGSVLDALRTWQTDERPIQLHPGDIAWFGRLGSVAQAAAVRVWHREGELVAVGLLDGDSVLRMTTAPGVADDRDIASQIAADVSDPGRGVLPSGAVEVEAPPGSAVPEVLLEHGWEVSEPWTPLRRDLTEPVEQADLHVQVVDARTAADWAAVVASSFGNPRVGADRWHRMMAAAGGGDAVSLVGYDGTAAVAAITVWSAGPGRPGLIEPMGVHTEHRRRGHGRAITLAGAAALREQGASSALVCTQSANVAGVRTYRAAGFVAEPERTDRARPA